MYQLIEENNYFIVINKFPGINFHNDRNQPGLFTKIKNDFSKYNLYPVHRLDKVTSGLLLIAKDEKTASNLYSQFKKRKIEKYYIALSEKKPKIKSGIITGDLKKSRQGKWKITKSLLNPSITCFISKYICNNLYFFIIKPITGKTHQIRVSLKSIGSGIIGDPKYCKKDNKIIPDRCYLHSYAIKFELSNIKYQFICKPAKGHLFLSKNFNNILNDFTNPWDKNWEEI